MDGRGMPCLPAEQSLKIVGHGLTGYSLAGDGHGRVDPPGYLPQRVVVPALKGQTNIFRPIGPRRQALSKALQATTDSGRRRRREKLLLPKTLEKAQLTQRVATARVGKLRVRLERSEARLARAAHDLKAMQALVDRAKLGKTSEDAKARNEAGGQTAEWKPGNGSRDRFLCVTRERVDLLIDRTDELITLRNQLQHFLGSLETTGCDEHVIRLGSTFAVGLDQVAGAIQRAALELRLVRLSGVFEPLPLLARDAGICAGKRIRLQVEGGDMEVDKVVADAIAGQLACLVRNAIDHGIELPKERQDAGKDSEGVVTVSAVREGNDIVISVRDDGRGIDPDAVRATAIARGLVAEVIAAKLSIDGICDLLFLPGYGPASAVSGLSGGGSGLGVLRASVRRAGGDVCIRSELGSFSAVDVRLPARISTREMLLVQAGEAWYAIPLDSVLRTMSVPAGGLRTLKGVPMIVSDEQLLPLRPLTELLGLESKQALPALLDVLVLDCRGQTGALRVDTIGRRQQLVVKPLDSLVASAGIGGAAVTADGRVVLVLDPESLLNMASQRT